MWDRANLKLSGGPHGIPPAVVREIQRDRLLKATVEVVARDGYAETTVRKLLAQAKLSRRTYYDLYHDKEDCYLDAFARIADELAAAAMAGFERADTPEEQVQAAIEALPAFCVEEPVAACACLVEGLAAGAAARAARTELVERLAGMLAPAFAQLRRSGSDPLLMARATVGGVFELLYGPLARRDLEQLRALVTRIGELPILPAAML
jgi:AcrR family transcriptional regulator